MYQANKSSRTNKTDKSEHGESRATDLLNSICDACFAFNLTKNKPPATAGGSDKPSDLALKLRLYRFNDAHRRRGFDNAVEL